MSASGFTASYTIWPNSYSQPLTSFISSVTYRAWGARKSTTYGNTVSESINYNSTLHPTSYTLSNVNYVNNAVSPTQSFSSMSWTYDYYADGRVNHAYDLSWNFWDRSYSYDHVGRLQEADTNKLARGQTWDYWHPDPYQQTSNYDVWNNLKLTGYQYNVQQTDSATYTNNRRSDQSYDAEGNVTANLAYNNSVDVASQNIHAISQQMVGDGSAQWPQQPASEIIQTYEANGRPYKRTEISRQNDRDLDTGEFLGVSEDTVTHHYVYSTALGAQVVDLDQSEQATVWIYAGGKRIAISSPYFGVSFEHHNPETTSRVTTNGHSANRSVKRDERDPQSGPVAPQAASFSAAQNWNQPLAFEWGDPSDFVPGVTSDGLPMTRWDFQQAMGKMGGMVSGDLVHYHVNWRDGSLINVTFTYWGSFSFFSEPSTSLAHTTPQNTLSRDQVGSLLDNIAKLFKDHPGCEEWTNKVLNELKSSTGFSTGSIGDILTDFRTRGIIIDSGKYGTGGGDTGTGRGYLAIGLTSSANANPNVAREESAVALLHEILHWAGIRPLAGGGYSNHYTDAVMATAWNKLGVVISADEYRNRYPEFAEATRKAAGYDYTESKLAGAANDITCLDKRPAVRTLR